MGDLTHERKGHVILFEHANFRGRHRHIFQNEEDLFHTDSPNDEHFNDITSSIVVLDGV